MLVSVLLNSPSFSLSHLTLIYLGKHLGVYSITRWFSQFFLIASLKQQRQMLLFFTVWIHLYAYREKSSQGASCIEVPDTVSAGLAEQRSQMQDPRGKETKILWPGRGRARVS